MKEKITTAACRFCGQMVQFDGDENLTEAQAEEQATMSCNCDRAVEYQKEALRKEKRCRTSTRFSVRTRRTGNESERES